MESINSDDMSLFSNWSSEPEEEGGPYPIDDDIKSILNKILKNESAPNTRLWWYFTEIETKIALAIALKHFTHSPIEIFQVKVRLVAVVVSLEINMFKEEQIEEIEYCERFVLAYIQLREYALSSTHLQASAYGYGGV